VRYSVVTYGKKKKKGERGKKRRKKKREDPCLKLYGFAPPCMATNPRGKKEKEKKRREDVEHFAGIARGWFPGAGSPAAGKERKEKKKKNSFNRSRRLLGRGFR